MPDIDRIEELQGQLRTWRQILSQTDEAASAIRDGWDAEDVTVLRDECRESIGALEEELAEIEGREYTAPTKVFDADHVRVGDAEDAIADLSEMASDVDEGYGDAIAELSTLVSDLYEMVGGE